MIYFLFKFDLFLISILKVYRKKPLRIYWEKACRIHYLYISLKTRVPSQVFKDFCVENLELTANTFLSKFPSEIYLSRIINYWASIFTLYLTYAVISWVCVLSVFSFFLPTHKHSFISSRFLTLFFNRSICNYQTDSWWDMKGLFIWRWAGPVRRAGWPRWDDFYPTFIWNLLSQFNQKVCFVAGKRLFDQVVFTVMWRKAIMRNRCSYII